MSIGMTARAARNPEHLIAQGGDLRPDLPGLLIGRLGSRGSVSKTTPICLSEVKVTHKAVTPKLRRRHGVNLDVPLKVTNDAANTGMVYGEL
jgi:hypothetical protein